MGERKQPRQISPPTRPVNPSGGPLADPQALGCKPTNHVTFPQACRLGAASPHRRSAGIAATQRCARPWTARGRGHPMLFFRQPSGPIFPAAGASRLWR